MIQKVFVYGAELVKVIDGDTIVLNIDLGCRVWLKEQHVRLAGLNTPELVGPSSKEAAQAKAWLVGILTRSKELIVKTSKPDPADKYGRWLAEIVADDTNVNQMMLTLGLAKAYSGHGPKL